MEDLSKQSYWEDRFLTEDSFEWFGDCSRLYPILDLYFKSSPSSILLHLGCGSSSLAEEMFARHYCHLIYNVDYSSHILDKRRRMNDKNNRCSIEWITLDIRSIPFRRNSFDTIIEKGTLDVFFVGYEHQLWHPSEDLQEKIDLILTEISQCLREDHGRFISISFQQPHFRRRFFAKEKYHWSIRLHSISDNQQSIEYFAYVMTKGETMSEEDQLLEQGISSKWFWINQPNHPSTIVYSNNKDPDDDDDDQYLFNITAEIND